MCSCKSKSLPTPSMLTGELSTLLNVFPLQELHISDQIKHEIVPNQAHLSLIFDKLEIRNASSCRAEIESLEEEIINRSEEQSKMDLITLIGIVRFAKCILFDASTPSPRAAVLQRNQSSELTIPTDYWKAATLLRILRRGWMPERVRDSQLPPWFHLMYVSGSKITNRFQQGNKRLSMHMTSRWIMYICKLAAEGFSSQQ
ncbi:U-box domain-containing protein 16-like [Cajanus cajan]|uniref:U-box domain-containing protein 16-like n=1 Tax=Cajanus cajan TaxID=3821 RepID=UPI00098D8EB0|nr:U-box domain-containing protein 16-like [Cajanus cajan]XP_029126951.1 U-box domain-containing protein 16-like [Cajanus cajan]